MSQCKVPVTTDGVGLVVTEPISGVSLRYQVRVAKGVAEVKRNGAFEILAYNLSTEERLMPKGMIMATGSSHPLDLVPIAGEIGREISQCPQIEGGIKSGR